MVRIGASTREAGRSIAKVHPDDQHGCRAERSHFQNGREVRADLNHHGLLRCCSCLRLGRQGGGIRKFCNIWLPSFLLPAFWLDSHVFAVMYRSFFVREKLPFLPYGLSPRAMLPFAPMRARLFPLMKNDLERHGYVKLANILGIPLSVCWKILNGKSGGSIRTWEKIDKAYARVSRRERKAVARRVTLNH